MVGQFALQPHPKVEKLWLMESAENVKFPTGDLIEVYAEVNTSCNLVHLNHGGKRMVSWKAASDVDLMFLLPSGEEGYVSMEVDRNLIR